MKLLKIIAVTLIVTFLSMAAFLNTPSQATAVQGDFNAAAFYKPKCAMCHGQKAEKKFDTTKSDDALAEVVLKGKADVKPKMPAYETKGVNADKAKALVAHMKSLRQ
jgi:cytochrome c553